MQRRLFLAGLPLLRLQAKNRVDVIALVTDRVFHDDNMLRYSLLYVCAAAWLLSALLWWIGLAPYRRTLDQLQSSPSPVLK